MSELGKASFKTRFKRSTRTDARHNAADHSKGFSDCASETRNRYEKDVVVHSDVLPFAITNNSEVLPAEIHWEADFRQNAGFWTTVLRTSQYMVTTRQQSDA